MAWTVLITDLVVEETVAELEETFHVRRMAEYETTDDIVADIHELDAILVGAGLELTAARLKRAERLKVVSKYGVGVDNIDVSAASENGVLVCNTPGANSQAVAEHALALLLAVRRNVVAADTALRAGEWGHDSRETFKGRELRGQTLGLFGCGNIAQRVARFGQALGMRCLAYDPYVRTYGTQPGIEFVDSKAALFESADVVSVHVPLTDETRGAVSRTELGRLPTDGLLINTSRGGIVDESALYEAIANGEIAGAGLDVFVDEPPSPEHPLLGLDEVVATAHLGGATEESDREKSAYGAANIVAVSEGEIPESTLNLDEIAAGAL